MFQWLSSGRQSLGGVGPVPYPSPNYPKYVPSLAAKPQQCLPSSLPPSDPGSARRSARRKVPEAPAVPRAGPQPAWRSAVPGLAWLSAAWPAPASDCAGPAAIPRAAFGGVAGCPLRGEGLLAHWLVLLGNRLPTSHCSLAL